MSFNDPEYRAQYIETHGIEAYNKAMAEHREKSVVARVNGQAIRAVASRFGTLYQIDFGEAFRTLAEAEEHAQKKG